MALEAHIRELAESKLTAPHQFIVDVVVSARKGPKKIMVIIDGDEGVNIDDCANISRELSKALDEFPELEESFVLEVSTPGLDYPLKLTRQYKKNVGRKLKVKMASQTVEGLLEAALDDKIVLVVEKGSGKKKEVTNIEIDYAQIEKAFVQVSFK